MKANINTIQNLIEQNFNGNKTAFAKALGVERSHVSHILSGAGGAGARFFGGLYKYCKINDLDFDKFIFLP